MSSEHGDAHGLQQDSDACHAAVPPTAASTQLRPHHWATPLPQHLFEEQQPAGRDGQLPHLIQSQQLQEAGQPQSQGAAPHQALATLMTTLPRARCCSMYSCA